MNLYEELKALGERPRPYERYTAETLWNDPHISRQMLRMHLDENTELASRKGAFMDASVAWMASRLGIREGTRVGDFGCGPGLYARRLAARGARVTGIDVSESSLAYAREEAARMGQEIRYVRCNYLDYRSEERFDLALLVYCDLCPLSPAQRGTLLGILREHLEPGGALVLDVCTLSLFESRSEGVLFGPALMEGFWAPGEYVGFQHSFKYPEERVLLDLYTILEPRRTWRVYNWLQCYDRNFLEAELNASGFRVEGFFSDVAGRPWEEGTPELAVVARRA